MRSMTGYGRGERAQDGFKVAVEINSVNRKQGEISMSLARELEPLESRIRDAIHQRVSRGRLTVKVTLHLGDRFSSGRVQLDVPLARAYARELRRLGRQLSLDGGLTLELLARAPGVVRTEESTGGGEVFWPAVEQALEKALDGLVRMREREGGHLANDLRRRMATVRRSVARVRRRAPAVPRRYREQLRERIRAAKLEVPDPEDERLLKEVVYFADRADVSEELTRLESHFDQFDECLRSREPVGRTLDFLAQEMNREVNTIGAKANDGQISREVVTLKAELEKFREQVQNVE